MSDKKDPGTALVLARLEPIDKAIVPKLGYYSLVDVRRKQKKALKELIKTGSMAGAGSGMLLLGLLLTSSSAPAALVVVLLSFGISFTLIGGLSTPFDIINLAKVRRLRALPEDTDEETVMLQGIADARIDDWNRRIAAWNEGWEILEEEERGLFALQDRCETKKSKRALVKRIELIRKEKRKYLKVRAALELERDRIISAITTLRKALPPPPEPSRLLEPPESEESAENHGDPQDEGENEPD